jgi:predicted RNase H-like nuclease (RuvC/YqgF family)
LFQKKSILIREDVSRRSGIDTAQESLLLTFEFNLERFEDDLARLEDKLDDLEDEIRGLKRKCRAETSTSAQRSCKRNLRTLAREKDDVEDDIKDKDDEIDALKDQQQCIKNGATFENNCL